MSNVKYIIDSIYESRLHTTVGEDIAAILDAKKERIRFFQEDCLQRKILFEKKIPMVCPRTGQINLRYDPEHVAEDFFITIRADKWD